MFQVGVFFYIFVLAAIVFGVTVWLYRRYALPETDWLTALIVVVAWYLAYSVTFMVPADLEVRGTNKDHLLIDIWKLVYWMAFGLTWVVLPVQQVVVASGYFRWTRRLWDAIYQNLVFYGVAGVLGIGLLVFISFKTKLTSAELQGILIALSNTWGMALFIMLLGYGLVEVPRKVWKFKDVDADLQRLYVKTISAHFQLENAMDYLHECHLVLKAERQKLEKDPDLRQAREFAWFLVLF